MWALAILDHRPAWILDCVLGHALDNLSSYSPNSLHLLVWSLAKLGHQPSEVRPGGKGERSLFNAEHESHCSQGGLQV